MGVLGLPSLLRDFCLSLVLLLPDHDLGSYSSRPRIPLLLPVQYHRKTSSFIGPLVSSVIIDHSGGNNSTPFYFLAALSAVSFSVLVFGLDLERSRREQEEFLVEEEGLRKERVVKVTDGKAVNGVIDKV